MMVDPYSAVKLSAIVGIACVVLGFPFAVFFGWLLARKSFRGKSLLTLVIFFPLSLPPVVTGLILLKALGRESFLGQIFGSLGLPLTFSLTGAVIASFIVGFPLYVMMIRSAFEAVDKRYEEVAFTLGLTPAKIFFKISLPLAIPGVLAGAVLNLARSMGEFGATSIISGNIEGETRTISLALYSLLEAPDGMESGRTLVIVSLIMSFLSLALYEWLLNWHRKRLELIDE
jgi:molybdate transport system permease protein